MKNHVSYAILVTLILSLIFSVASFAEEAAPSAPTDVPEVEEAVPAELTEETEFSYGTVKSVGPDQLVVSEYDYESNADVDVTYKVQADTEFENVASLNEIAVGDAVDIDYLVKEADKVAVAITVEKPTAEDEEAALMPADEIPQAE